MLNIRQKKLLRIIESAVKKQLKEGQYGTFDWAYYYLKDGCIVDEKGKKVFPKSPKFDTLDDAEEWLKDNDERGNVIGDYDQFKKERQLK